MKIINDKDRIFESGISFEIKDRQGDIIPLDDVERAIVGILKRGGNLMDNHTNKQVGKVLSYKPDVTIDPETGNEVQGFSGVFQIFDDYAHDDDIWNGIKNMTKTGISLGGENYDSQYDGERNAVIRRAVDGFELSVVDRPANPLALIRQFNAVAKSDNKNLSNEEVNKVEAEELKKSVEDLTKTVGDLAKSVADIRKEMDESDKKKKEEEEALKKAEEEKQKEEEMKKAEEDKLKAEADAKAKAEEEAKCDVKKVDELTKKVDDLTKGFTEFKSSLEKLPANARSDVNKADTTQIPKDNAGKEVDVGMQIVRGEINKSWDELAMDNQNDTQKEVDKLLGY